MRRRDFTLFAASSAVAATDALADPDPALRGKKFKGGLYFVTGNAHQPAAGAAFDANGSPLTHRGR